MFKKRVPKGQKRAAAAAPPADADADAAAPSVDMDEVKNAQYWRKRSKGLSAADLGSKTAAAAPQMAVDPKLKEDALANITKTFGSGGEAARASDDAALEAYRPRRPRVVRRRLW
mmetsp:Transcript_10786/g.33226  ORF Transcript_10786/g.33226 Transcript_10786/m.33226 type:complete len:115 (+) Transcript_10786:1106-1450(+)